MPATQHALNFMTQGVALMRGEAGMVLTAYGAVVGRLTGWRVTSSPATGMLVLFAEGHFRRHWLPRRPVTIVARLIPVRPAVTLRRPHPKTPPPQQFTGTLLELSIGRLTANMGVMLPL